jgi:hypothetical protein
MVIINQFAEVEIMNCYFHSHLCKNSQFRFTDTEWSKNLDCAEHDSMSVRPHVLYFLVYRIDFQVGVGLVGKI